MKKPVGKTTLKQYKKSSADVREDKASAKAVGVPYKTFKKSSTATKIDKEIVNMRNSVAKKGKKNGKK